MAEGAQEQVQEEVQEQVQEQMGDILSAFGIPELAKDIYAIPLDSIDPQEEDEERKAGEAKTSAEGGDEEQEGGEGKAPGDEAMEEGGSTKKEDAENTSRERNDDDENENEETSMDTEDTEDSGADSPKATPGTNPETVESSGTSSAQVMPDLGLTQSVAPAMGNQAMEVPSLMRQLLTAKSKPVMTPMLQEQLQKPTQASSDFLNTNAQYNMDVDDDEAIPNAPSALHSMDEFNSYFDQCKGALDLLEMKKTILGEANCIAAYKCPQLTEEQMKVLVMNDETFKCLGCDNGFLFKTSLDSHMERRTALIAFSCKWCTDRQDLVFYNKCNFLAHLHRHNASAMDVADVVAQAIVKPVTAVECFKLFNKITAPKKKRIANLEISRQKEKTGAIPSRPAAAVTSNARSILPQSASGRGSSTPSPFAISSGSDEDTGDSGPEDTTHRTPVSKPSSKASVALPFRCCGCDKKFAYRELLQNHLQEISSTSTLLQCQICKMFLGNSCKVNMHTIIHKYAQPGNNGMVPCPECGSIFKDLKSLMIHENNDCMHWLKRPLFKCKFCFKYATSYTGLIRHFESNHVDIFYKCNLCQLAFRTSDSAVEHYMQVHRSKGKSFGLLHKCPFCKSVYSERKILESHFENHYKTGDFKIEKFVYSCFMCNKPFDQPKSMKAHVTATHRKPNARIFSCDICLMTTSDVHYLMEHRYRCAMRTMGQSSTPAAKTAEKPAATVSLKAPLTQSKPVKLASTTTSRKVFMCGECGEKFTEDSIADLRKHMLEKHATKINEASLKEAKPLSGSSAAGVSGKASTNQKSGGSGQGNAPQGNAPQANAPQGNVPQASAPQANAPQASAPQQPKPVMRIKRFMDMQCAKCSHKCTNRFDFEKHIATHKQDDFHSQCHECGLCFTVEQSLRKHLFIKHKIKDMATFNKLCEEIVKMGETESRKKRQDIVEKKQEEKEKKQDDTDETSSGKPSEENPDESSTEENPEVEVIEEPTSFKCQVCKAEFENEKTLTYHKRSHGLAYLQHQLSRSPEKASKPSSIVKATPPPKPVVKPPPPTHIIDTDSSEESVEDMEL